VTERETNRLIAWSKELRRVHERLREALRVAQEAVAADSVDTERARDLLLYCHGFCVALDRHHKGEDRTLFPAIEAAHPELAPVLEALQRDHSMIEHLIRGLSEALDRSAPPSEVSMHLEGIAAIMESHFRYEERQLLVVLETLALDASVESTLGPL